MEAKSSSKHTPGPLFVKATVAPCNHNGDIGIVNDKGSLIAVAFARPEVHANARLIAAAPELLEALQAFAGVENFNGWHDKYHEAIKKAHAAMAKAAA